MIRKLAHLCYVTDNLPALKAFYTDMLGLPVKFAFRNKDGEIFGYYIDCGDSSFIEIFDRVGKAKMWNHPLDKLTWGNRFTHCCLEVSGLKEFRDKLVAKGLKVSEISRGIDHGYQAWTNDPDGNAIELMEYSTDALQIQHLGGEHVICQG